MKEQLHIERPKVGLIKRSSEAPSRLVFGLDPEELGGEEKASEAYKLLVWLIPYCIPTIHLPDAANASFMVDV